MDISSLKSDPNLTLTFEISDTKKTFEKRPFEFEFSREKDEFMVMLNLASSISALDWLPRKKSEPNTEYLAVAAEPIRSLVGSFFPSSTSSFDFSGLLKPVAAPNLVHVLRFDNLNSPDSFSLTQFSILNRQVGYCNVLKWRPDFGASQALKTSDFLGYLLIAGSDGNGYVYSVDDLTKHKDYVPDLTGIKIANS